MLRALGWLIRAVLWDIFTPSQLFRQCWDAFMIALILGWVCVIVPFTVCFNVQARLPSGLGEQMSTLTPVQEVLLSADGRRQ